MKDNYNFISFKDENIEINFSTANNDMNFNCNVVEGRTNINKIKNWFGIDEIAYLNQTHSDIICEYDKSIHEGDAIYTNEKNIAVGVFTADCVPILIYDKRKEVVAAVHSGWKGTLKKITYKTISKIVNEYGSDPKDIKIYIGPHNRGCCYEFGREALEDFNNDELYKDLNIYSKGKLDLSKCIVEQILLAKVPKENIIDLQICTFCSKEYKMFSFRKDKGSSRLFSFIYIKK